jgi:CheY-like chemotaxis protein
MALTLRSREPLPPASSLSWVRAGVQIRDEATYRAIVNPLKLVDYGRRFGCWSANKWRRSPLKLILLVDDSRFVRMATEKALSRAGYSVVTASDGEEALRIASSRIPDLILLDMLLPRLGGVEVLQALQKSPLTASIPVIVLSSLPQKNEAKLLTEGATAYFEKSKMELDQNAESLIHIVKRTLELVKGGQPA